MNKVKTMIYVLFFSNSLLTASNRPLYFKHLTTENGLSQSSITCILQDSMGFMWFGTQDGLNRYDGYSFTVYRHHPGDTVSISSNSINALFQDSQGNLWVGTGGGLNLYNRAQNTFKHFKHSEMDSSSVSNDNVMSISEDHDGKIWIATKGGGINRFDRESGKFTCFRTSNSQLSSDDVYVTFLDNRNHLWIGSWYGDVDLYHIEENQFKHYPKMSENIIRNIIEDQEQNIWICTHGDGIVKLHSNNREDYRVTRKYKHAKDRINSLSGDAVYTILEDTLGQFWIGTENEGINLFDSKSETFFRYKSDISDKNSLSQNSIWSLYKDVAGDIWVGTHMGGINLLYQNRINFLHYQHNPGNPKSLSYNSVTSFYEDRQGNFWIGTDGGGLNQFNRDSGQFTCFNKSNSRLSSDEVLSIFEDSRGKFWVGTWGGGLNLFNRKNGDAVHYTKDESGLCSDNVFSILEDRQGKLWIGALWGGVSCLDSVGNRFKSYSLQNSNLTDNDIRVIAEDKDGYLWIGGGLGLNKMDIKKGSIEKYQYNENDPNSISQGWVLSILIAKDSTLWVGTTYGLNRFHRKTGQFTRYYIKDGLPNDVINGIEEDEEGCLWISTNKGISRFNPKTDVFTNYDVSDGLQSNEFYQCSHFKSHSGEMFFGGAKGFNVFNPKKLIYNPFIPPVYITDFQIFNKPVKIGPDSPLKVDILETHYIILNYRESMITFEFTALNYISSEKNQYAYRMKNFDPEWNYVGTKRTATYTNLNHGEYTFLVKGSNNNGIWNEEGKSLKIYIKPPIWKIRGFKIGFTIFITTILSIFLLWINSIIVRSKKIEKEGKELIAELNKERNQRLKELEDAKNKIENTADHAIELIGVGALGNLYFEAIDFIVKNFDSSAALYSVLNKDEPKKLKLINCLPLKFKSQLKDIWILGSKEGPYINMPPSCCKHEIIDVSSSKTGSPVGYLFVHRNGTPDQPAKHFEENDIHCFNLLAKAIGNTLKKLIKDKIFMDKSTKSKIFFYFRQQLSKLKNKLSINMF